MQAAEGTFREDFGQQGLGFETLSIGIPNSLSLPVGLVWFGNFLTPTEGLIIVKADPVHVGC